MLAAALLLAQVPVPPANAKAALAQVRQSYQSLTSLEVDLVHENSSGLFPGHYRQHLSWKPGTFSLKVIQPAEKEERTAPDYVYDGTTVTSEGGRGYRFTESRPLNTDPNVLPGYEVCGTPVLSWLLKTANADLLFNPPNGAQFNYRFGPAVAWRGRPAREIVLTFSIEGRENRIRFFTNPRFTQLLGFSAPREDGTSVIVYENEVRTPA